jgi:uncharacterized protein (TIGR02145 family)
MKAIIACMVVLVMSVASYGLIHELYIFTNSGKVTYNLANVDSLAFGKNGVPGDSLLDSRDGQKYATIFIGTQCWMAENLNIGTRINGNMNQTNNSIIEKYAYADDDSNADMYGGLYQWDEAMQYSTTEGMRGICPDGWHLPTDTEWKALEMALGVSPSQADTDGWHGTDQGTLLKAGGTSGFQALFAGERISSVTFYGLDSIACFWSSTQRIGSQAWYGAWTSITCKWPGAFLPK